MGKKKSISFKLRGERGRAAEQWLRELNGEIGGVL